MLCSFQKRRRFFDYRGIHQVERKISFNAVRDYLHGNYGIDKRWIHRAENSVFYLKSADASGMPLPLRIFDYKERTTAAQQALGGSVAAESVNFDNFVTRKEFDELKASIASQTTPKKNKNNLTEDAKNE